LPSDWIEQARETRAFCKAGGVPSPHALLQLLLRHVLDNDSLKRTTALAAAEGGPAISSVALHKRLGRSGDWLEGLVRGVGQRATRPVPELGRRVLLVDATVITQPASTGADWRLHTLFNLGDLTFADAVLTDGQGGEGLPRFPLQPGDLVIADRGYAYPPTAAYAQACGADVVLRWKSRATGMRTHTGARFDLGARLAAVSPTRTLVDWTTTLQSTAGLIPGRLIAERRDGTWFLLWTTLARATCSARRLVECYRARWQVELLYKRHKSLFGGDHLPKVRPDTARAWILAKVLAHQLMTAEVEAALAAAHSLPPPPPTPARPARSSEPVGVAGHRPPLVPPHAALVPPHPAPA
jgi:hypothetical protein